MKISLCILSILNINIFVVHNAGIMPAVRWNFTLQFRTLTSHSLGWVEDRQDHEGNFEFFYYFITIQSACRVFHETLG